MPMFIRCPNPQCAKGLKIKEEHVGKKAKCPACGHAFTVPGADAPLALAESLPDTGREPLSAPISRPGPSPAAPEQEHPPEKKSFFGRLKEAAAKSGKRASSFNKCSDCGAKMTMFEVAAKMGKCSRCAAKGIGLVRPDSGEFVFSQSASYRGGLSGFPGQGKKAGFAVVFENCFCFFDNQVRWAVPYEKILRADLDFFQPSGLRAVLAGTSAIMMQRVRNNVAITYLADEGTEYTAKLQIHGALSIPGEEAKASELLNHILRFKSRFARAVHAPQGGGDDVAARLEKLADLKNKGIITDAEYQAKRKDLLERL